MRDVITFSSQSGMRRAAATPVSSPWVRSSPGTRQAGTAMLRRSRSLIPISGQSALAMKCVRHACMTAMNARGSMASRRSRFEGRLRTSSAKCSGCHALRQRANLAERVAPAGRQRHGGSVGADDLVIECDATHDCDGHG
ncbi:MAG TPA: hypothetical protein VFU97_02265 [Xanthobacteraceae bacterium]|nr:hypothetical protein [Xanthobacteraceae bacterium]